MTPASDEIQNAGIALTNVFYGYYAEAYDSKAQTQTVISGMRLFWLYFLMAWGIWVQAGLISLAKAAAEDRCIGLYSKISNVLSLLLELF